MSKKVWVPSVEEVSKKVWIPSVEEVPAPKLSRAGDVTLMNWQDALIRVVDCQRELKQAKAELKTAQAARVEALVQRSFGETLL